MNKINKDRCCGCFACVSYCPQQAITVEEDNITGFYYPIINNNLCIDCGLCDEICEFAKAKRTEANIIAAFGLQHKNHEVLKDSTSGGAFTAFSDIILGKGGAVAGAVMENFHIVHRIADKAEQRDAMRGSKYVQSDMLGLYEKIENSLKAGKPFLFTGTPCQSAAIKQYFGERYKGQLFILDFLCHGVPSEKMFRNHIDYISQKCGKQCIDYKFRSKDFSWRSHVMEGALFEGKSNYSFKAYMQRLYSLFNSGASLRPSCHNCKYKSRFRYSDITIADFWGIEQVAPGKNNALGHSLVLVNSNEGKTLMEELISSNTVDIFKVPVSDIMFRIACKPIPIIPDQDSFWSTYAEKGYLSILNKYSPITTREKIRFEIKKIFLKRR